MLALEYTQIPVTNRQYSIQIPSPSQASFRYLNLFEQCYAEWRSDVFKSLILVYIAMKV